MDLKITAAWSLDRLMAELGRLPGPDFMHASKITDTLGADVSFSGRTVLELLAQERERCAKECEAVASSLECAEDDGQAMGIGAHSCVDAIRALNR